MKLKAVHKKRLLKLAKFLREEIAPKQRGYPLIFDMRNWLEPDAQGHIHKRASIDCGTTACAAGWATAIFPELTFSVKHGHIHLRGEKCREPSESAYFAHVGKFFGLPVPDHRRSLSGDLYPVYHLFYGETNRLAAEEADVIEEFVKENS